jgi:hypothetical protein
MLYTSLVASVMQHSPCLRIRHHTSGHSLIVPAQQLMALRDDGAMLGTLHMDKENCFSEMPSRPKRRKFSQCQHPATQNASEAIPVSTCDRECFECVELCDGCKSCMERGGRRAL